MVGEKGSVHGGEGRWCQVADIGRDGMLVDVKWTVAVVEVLK